MPELSLAKPGALKSKSVPTLEHVIMMTDKDLGGAFKFDDVFNSAESKDFERLSKVEKIIQMDDPFNIQFTSVGQIQFNLVPR